MIADKVDPPPGLTEFEGVVLADVKDDVMLIDPGHFSAICCVMCAGWSGPIRRCDDVRLARLTVAN